jgi:hypothetical protein
MEPLRPNQQRAWYVILLFWTLVGFLFVTLLVDFNTLWQFRKSAAGEPEIQQMQGFRSILGIFILLLQIVGAVFFIRWFRRAYANLHRLETVKVDHAESWAVWSWFVPILNFFRPYQILIEIWEKTQEAYKGKDNYDSRWQVDLWWMLFLLTLWMMYRMWTGLPDTPTFEDYAAATATRLFADAVMLLGALFTLEILYRTRRYEVELYQHRQNYDPLQHLVEASER